MNALESPKRRDCKNKKSFCMLKKVLQSSVRHRVIKQFIQSNYNKNTCMIIKQ